MAKYYDALMTTITPLPEKSAFMSPAWKTNMDTSTKMFVYLCCVYKEHIIKIFEMLTKKAWLR